MMFINNKMVGDWREQKDELVSYCESALRPVANNYYDLY